MARVLATVQSLQDALERLKRLGAPFLTWTGKAERQSFDVPTMPLFVHERLSTRAIVETLIGHKTDKQQSLFDLFADPQHSIADQVMRAYEHQDRWVNRMILGDSLVVMNSLLQYEGLGGQVQMIYIDPPYGVKFGSHFQPFVRKRDVSHNGDEDLTREPEMVKAYRDTYNQMYSFEFDGRTYTPSGRGWRTTETGMERLREQKRLTVSGNTLRFVQFADDFPVFPLQSLWNDTGTVFWTLNSTSFRPIRRSSSAAYR